MTPIASALTREVPLHASKKGPKAPSAQLDVFVPGVASDPALTFKPYRNGLAFDGPTTAAAQEGPTATSSTTVQRHSHRLYLQYTPVTVAPGFYHTNVLLLDEKGNGHEWAAYPKYREQGAPTVDPCVKDVPVKGFDLSSLQPISGELDDSRAARLEKGLNDLTDAVAAKKFEYNGVLQNSNSYAATLLHGTGYSFPIVGHPPTPGCGKVLIPWTGW